MSDVISQTNERTGRVAAIYARVSSERQRQDETIHSQTVGLRELAAERGLLLPEDLIFEDEGFSGATLTRPALQGCATAPPRELSSCCSVTRRIGWRAATPTRCCCSTSSPAPGWRSYSPRSPSGAARPRTSCCASSRA